MKIALEGFGGEIPKTQPRYLQSQYAAAVANARLNRGDLEPMRDAVTIETLGAAADRIYLYGSTWLSWAVDADAAPGPVAQDRLYITTANAAPQLLYSGQFHPLALNAPTIVPTLTALSTPDPALAENIVYSYTWVTSLGEESPPSPLSAALSWSPGVVVRVATSTNPPANRLVTTKRLYRSVTSASGITDLYFVAERPVAEASFDHDLTVNPANEPLSSTDYDPPPATMRGIITMPNGIMAAFSGKEVLFCEPYIPHAWPLKYRQTVNDTIVGLAAFGSTLAVLTTGTPYLLQGIHPSQMAMDRSEFAFPCLSKRGIADMGYAAVYPSTDGLVQIGVGGAKLVSEPLWTPEQWRAMQPGSFRAGHHGGRYAFSYIPKGSATRTMAFIDMTGQQPFLLPHDVAYKDLHDNIETGRLCALAADGVTVVSVDDDAGALLQYQWRSKPFKLPAAIGLGAVKIDAIAPASGVPAFILSVYRDGALLHAITDPSRIARIPSGLSEDWQFEIAGNYTVTRAVIASTPEEASS